MLSPKSGLKIALVSAFPPGQQSLNEYGLHLAKGLAERGDVAEVVVIADRLETPGAELDLGPKIRVRRDWDFNKPSSIWRVLSALREENADSALYNLQTATFGDRELPAGLGLLTPLASRIMGTPSGVILHNLISGIDLDSTKLKGQRLRQAFVRQAGKMINLALVSSNYATVTLESYRDSLAKQHPGADVALVPHGTFDVASGTETPNSERPMRLVTMGKFGTYKRLETLLAAFDILRRAPGFSSLQLEIGGSDHPSTPGYMAKIANERRDDPDVTFKGYVPEDEMTEFFGTARICIFDYSATTGSSGVLHQTASYGAVPIFPNIGDFVDVCRNEGLDGVHFTPGSAEDMAAAMARVLNNPTEANQIADSNLRASQDFPFSKVIDFHVRKMNALLGEAPTAEVHVPAYSG